MHKILKHEYGRNRPVTWHALFFNGNPFIFRLLSCLLSLAACSICPPVAAGTPHPYYQRRLPAPQPENSFESDTTRIDFSNAHMPAYGALDPVAEANRLFDSRAAAAVRASTGVKQEIRIVPPGGFSELDLLETKSYGVVAPTIYIPTAKCLAAMAYVDYFPGSLWKGLRSMVSTAILEATPGWCGTFGPGVDGTFDLLGDFYTGDYDMTQMHLLPLVYRYYDELSPAAREHLIIELLAHGRIHRPRLNDNTTHGEVPGDWSRAGFISPLGYHVRIGETENHILMILTVRYLTNQLLYQRSPNIAYDNRRNGGEGHPSCILLVLTLLQNMLRDDFSEYNAKSYQAETRWALLNLCSYAYDGEVRLAARMVLDYISAHIVVSSSDLRRLVPFRRRNEGRNSTQLPGGVMNVGLLEWFLGADPLLEQFAIQAGNLRAYEAPWEARSFPWSIASAGGDATMEALSDYRLPPSIHDLFVNDSHRRFFQRLHRFILPDVEITGRNCDNMEIYAGSPSYLISAGGSPATYALDPGPALLTAPGRRKSAQQLGVAVTTSFMPTGLSAGPNTQNMAGEAIQLSRFSEIPGGVANYGVAPDLAFGHTVHLPKWCLDAININERRGKFVFVNKRGPNDRPGFYLAVLRDGDFTVIEAFDTWLHPELSFDQFRSAVWERNKVLSEAGLSSNVEPVYTTQNGNRVRFVIWTRGERNDSAVGAKVIQINYGPGDPTDRLGDAGNITDRFLSGTILNSPADALVEISNPFLGTRITLDLRNIWNPRRTSENGEVEEAGLNHEVWVDFSSTGAADGDFFHPFNTLAKAVAFVAPGGVIKIMPGSTDESPILTNRVKVIAPIGGVRIGAR